jgi:ABC-type transport system substrate-binding protein
VWVSNELAGTLTRIDPGTNTPTPKSVSTGNSPQGLVVDGAQLFVAVRASGTGHRGGTLTELTDGSDVPTLDPAAAVNVHQTQLITLAGDGLLAYRKVGGSPGNGLVPDLAASIPAPTDGGRSYTFRLRPGIRYSTGALVQPADFRRGLERTMRITSTGGGGSNGEIVSAIVGASACLEAPKKPCDLSSGGVADRAAGTVTFHLTAPRQGFLYNLAQVFTYPVPAGTPTRPLPYVAGTGPYRIVSFDPKTGARLERNPYFREWSRLAQPDGYPDVIDVHFGGTADGRNATVLGNGADLASGVSAPSPATLQSLRTRHFGRLKVNPWYSNWFVVFNTRVAPFDNVLARRALNFAIDRAHCAISRSVRATAR